MMVGFTSLHPPYLFFEDLFPDNLDEDAFMAATVELAVEDLLPGTEVQTPVCDRHHYFTPHYLPLQMGVGIILTHIMAILGNRFMGRQFFQPDVIVMVQSGFIVVDKY